MVKKILPILILVGTGIYLAYLSKKDLMWEGGGDNYWHFYFSRYSYQYPQFFLHHWGKPLYILLSGPFAQFGFYGVQIFNVLCGLGSAWVVYLFCRDAGLKGAWISIFMVLFTPVYFLVLQSAMTEPLFGFVVVLSSYLLFKEKYLLGAIVASTILYARSEGMFIIVFYLAYLILCRKWKYLPFLLTAFLIYSFIGYLAGHDFLWYFTENPYSEVSAYGHGTWMHFISNSKYRVIWGVPHTVAVLFGSVILIFKSIKERAYLFWNKPSTNTKVFVLVFLPALSYIFFHFYAWAMGKYGSAGLERVFSCSVPLTIILAAYFIDFIIGISKRKVVSSVLIAGFICFYAYETFGFYKYPMRAYGPERVERKLARWFVKERKPNKIVYYAHPAIMFFGNYDPFDKKLNRECFDFPKDCVYNPKEPFYYIWDSMFSGTSCNNLEDLKRCPDLRLLRVFDEGQNFSVYVFEYGN